MTTSKKIRLGFGTTIVLLGLCVLTLLIRWPSPGGFDAGSDAILRDARFSFGLTLIFLVAAAVSAVVTGMAISRSLVNSQETISENSEEHYLRSAEAAGLGAYSYDLESQTAEWSAALKKIHGLPVDADVNCERILELIHPNDREHFRQRLAGMFSSPEGVPFESEFRIVRPDGAERWLRDRGQFTFAGSGRSRHPVRVRGMILDITDQKRAEDLQHESEARHRAAFDGSAVGMCQADPVTGHLLRVNHRLCLMLGFSNSELLNLPCQDILHPDDRDSMLEGLIRLRGGELSEYQAEKRFVRKDGGMFWGDVTVNLVQDPRGRPLRTVALIKDINERKQAEEKVRATERQLRAFLDNSAVCGWMKDDEGRYVFLSKNYERHLGVPAEEMLGKTDFDYWPHQSAEQFRANDRNVLATDRAIEVLEEGETADGKHPWWLCHKFPYRDETGKRFVGGLAVDLTEHKRIEDELRDSEERLSLVIQGVNVGLFDWELGGDTVRFSREWKSQLGYAENEIGERFEEWQSRVHPEDLESTLAKARSYLEKPWPDYEVEFRMRHKDGSWRWILARAAMINDSTGKPVRMIGIHLDITARKEVEESLREIGERLRLANEAANIGTYFGDMEADRVRYSPELCAMLGVEAGIDRKLEDGFQFVQPEDLRQLRADFKAAINPAGDGRQRTEVRITRPNGEVRWLVTSAQFEFRNTPTGRVPWRIVGACLDITERKRIEVSLRQLNDQLEERVAERTRVLYAKQERLQAILNSEFNAIMTIDRQGLVESVNLAAVKMFGDSVDGMIGQDFNRFVLPPDGHARNGSSRSYLEMGLARMPGYSLEVVARRQDGSTFPADLAVSEIAHLGLYCGILRDLSEHKRLEREVSEATAFEQRRIGQDLHDSVGQQLTAMSMVAQDFVESLRPDPTTSTSAPHTFDPLTPSSTLSSLSPFELAERLRRDLQKALEEVRSISRNLNPVPIDSQGLMVALTDLVERMRLQSRVICTFDCAFPVVIEDNVTATHLFHIAQEALSNALRHAQAREIRISLQHDELQIILRIQDDGDGVSWSLPQREGLGMRIMKNRADVIGATLTVDRARPNGTIVSCHLPNGSKHQD